jgi:hypothetical protein
MSCLHCRLTEEKVTLKTSAKRAAKRERGTENVASYLRHCKEKRAQHTAAILNIG